MSSDSNNCCYHGSPGDCLVLLAAALAVQIAQGRTLEDIETLSAFFASLSDNLALIAVKFPDCDDTEQKTSAVL